ncbi:hypothetical protein [[Mycoplasma] collis]|uniref:hypothetical protein n=1 Tax=[Mycoplasma] collis TaxID=2127 RepID=UPI00051B5FCB|nr:hypothetical protein [[Mycoplasma] collis]
MKANLFKYIFAIFISLIGSESFKLGSSLYIFRFQGSQCFIVLMYLLIQVPAFIIYIFSKKLSKINSKFSLILSDILSIFLLSLSIVFFFTLSKNFEKVFSISLIVLNSALAFVHSFRFIHLKNILYFCTKIEEEVKKYNYVTTWATSIAFLMFPLFSLFFNYFSYYYLIFFNIFTYLLSAILYYLIKLNKNPIIFSELKKGNIVNIKTNKYNKWFFTIFFSIIIGVVLYPKQSGMFQYLGYSKFEFISLETATIIISMVSSFFGFLGAIVIQLLNKNKKNE